MSLVAIIIAFPALAGLLLAVLFLRRRRGWVLGAWGLVAVLVLLAGIMHLYGSRRLVSREEAGDSMTRAEIISEGDLRDGALPFLANVYPSPDLAARALAVNLADSLQTVSADDHHPPAIHLTGQADQSLLQQAAEALQRRVSSRVEVEPAGPGATSQPGNATVIVCKVHGETSDEGTVQMVLKGPTGQVSRSAQFIRKDWAANFAKFVSKTSGNWILARSHRPCTAFGEAEQGALDDAAVQLLPHFEQAINRRIASGGLDPRLRPRRSELRSAILGELRRGMLISDRFAQPFSRPYADLWQQSLLVDASSDAVNMRVDQIAGALAGQRSVEVRSWLRTAISIGGLAVLIFLVYLLLNAATKGYYTWALRLAAVALLTTGAILALIVA